MQRMANYKRSVYQTRKFCMRMIVGRDWYAYLKPWSVTDQLMNIARIWEA